jgi:hypothetical protein
MDASTAPRRLSQSDATADLLIRMLIISYCMDIHSERRLRHEVYLILACRWFCCLGLDSPVPTTQPLPRTRTAASATAIVYVSCLRQQWRAASRKVWWAGTASRWVPA